MQGGCLPCAVQHASSTNVGAEWVGQFPVPRGAAERRTTRVLCTLDATRKCRLWLHAHRFRTISAISSMSRMSTRRTGLSAGTCERAALSVRAIGSLQWLSG